MKTYDYSRDILDSLLKNEVIDETLYEKCSKPHINSLPYDLRTNDNGKLTERKNEIENKITEVNNNIEKNKKGLNLSTYTLTHNMTDTYESHVESLLQGMYPNLKINSFVDTQQKEVKNTRETYKDGGYENEYNLISNDLLNIYDTTRLLSHMMKNTYEDNVIKDTLTDSKDIYNNLELSNQFKSILTSCDNLDKNVNQILKNKDFPFKEIKNIPKYSSNIKKDITTLNNIYENYKQGIKINKREEEILSDLEAELMKVNNKLK